jgi:ATP-dependent Lon protease
MRDFRDAKAMAQSLRHALNAKSVSLTHGECLELIAKTLGFPDWNVLAARIQSGQPTVTESGASAPAAVPPSLPCGAGVPIIAMRDLVVFPQMVVPIFVGRDKTRRAMERAMASDGRVLMVTQRRATDDDPTLDALYAMGVTASVIKRQTLANGTLKIFVSGLERAAIGRVIEDEFLTAELAPFEETRGQTAEAEALSQRVLDAYMTQANIISLPQGPQAYFRLPTTGNPGMLADSVAQLLSVGIDKKQQILETSDVVTRLDMILELMKASPPTS